MSDDEAGAEAEAEAEAEERLSVDNAARNLMRQRQQRPEKEHGALMRLYRGETRFDFDGRRRIWFTLSGLLIAAGILSIILRGGLNLGIEFKGGTEWTVKAPGVTQTQALNAVANTGLVNPIVQLLGSGSSQTLTVQSDLNKLPQKSQTQISNKVEKALVKLTSNGSGTGNSSTGSTTTTSTSASTTTTTAATTTTTAAGAVGATSTTTSTTTPKAAAAGSKGNSTSSAEEKIGITQVGPTWGGEITNKAIEALIIFFIVVAAYISIRFEPKMALAAFIAMLHDVLVAVGVYSLFNFQVTPDTVVAILTILGYSLYDTVVVFDRVRDNTRGIGASGRLSYSQLINLSMNQTMARSINTSMVAILPVLAVLLIGAQLLGASTLKDYGLALFVGLLSGAYSSIFIASPVLSMLKRRESRWVAIEQRLISRGERSDFYSAADAAALSTQISISASGQAAGPGQGSTGRGRSTPAKRTGPIRPGAGTERGSSATNGAPPTTGSGAGTAATPGAPRPRKGKGKRKR
ncbi:MAG TPA: protein translocase subunit SecF [Acidimicrobiales bacterium]|nr:protein translocase subunit SecF [Acidimicrobiales bacterium]